MNRKLFLTIAVAIACFCSEARAANNIKVLPTSGTINIDMSQWWDVLRLTPAGACTLNVSGAPSIDRTGEPTIGRFSLVVTTSGTTSFVITFGTNFKTQGTLSTGTVSGKKFCISFVCEDGTVWVETGRTVAM